MRLRIFVLVIGPRPWMDRSVTAVDDCRLPSIRSIDRHVCTVKIPEAPLTDLYEVVSNKHIPGRQRVAPRVPVTAWPWMLRAVTPPDHGSPQRRMRQ